jgi:hypothetical protein
VETGQAHSAAAPGSTPLAQHQRLRILVYRANLERPVAPDDQKEEIFYISLMQECNSIIIFKGLYK